MKRCGLTALVLALALTARPARGHFLFFLPAASDAKGPGVRLVFSDNLEPGEPKLLDKVKHTEVFEVGPDGQAAALKTQPGKDCFEVPLTGDGPRVVAGVCRYGVLKRGEGEPFLLCYYPKTFVRATPRDDLWFRACERLPLEIVPIKELRTVRVLWQGKPLAEAEVTAWMPGQEKTSEGKTDKEGRFILPDTGPVTAGVYAVSARHVEKKAGEHDGKKYAEVRHYASLTFEGPRAGAPGAAPKADPAATKLLADALAARANWIDFPGFKADLEINIDGKVFKTPVTVSAKGEVELKCADEDAGRWARRQLASLVDHRLGASGPTPPCAFADDNEHHPLGRAITVLDSESHSSYRIRDRQVIVVNRTMQGSRFSIVVLENVTNAEGKFLPGCYVVNYWDGKTDALKRSDAHHDSWKRVGAFDLPTELVVLSAGEGTTETRSLKLSNHQLLKR